MADIAGMLNFCDTRAEKRRIQVLLAQYDRAVRLAKRRDLTCGTRQRHIRDGIAVIDNLKAFLETKP